MKTISLSVSKIEYDAFKRAAKEEGRPVAQLIREAMAYYRAERMQLRTPLDEVPVLLGHRPLSEPPSRQVLWDEIAESDS